MSRADKVRNVCFCSFSELSDGPDIISFAVHVILFIYHRKHVFIVCECGTVRLQAEVWDPPQEKVVKRHGNKKKDLYVKSLT